MTKQTLKNPSLMIKDQLCFQIYTASRLFTQVYLPKLEKLDLTYPQYLVMMALWEEDQKSVKELGEILKLDSGTLSPVLKKLEAKGYLIRSRLSSDERVVSLKLTTEGKNLKKAAKFIPDEMACQTQMPLKEIIALRELIEKLNAHLEGSI